MTEATTALLVVHRNELREVSVCRGELGARLADAIQYRSEPWCGDIERLAATHPAELDGSKLVAALFVMADQTGLAP